jgi:uncharacterized protein (DUF2062 family)
VASGFAIGIAVGCIPFFGIQTVIALFLALVFRVNKVSCVLASVWTNPVTAFPVYYTCYRFGLLITGRDGVGFEQFSAVLNKAEASNGLVALGAGFFIPLAWGCLFAALILSPLAYYSVLWWLAKRSRMKKAKALQNIRDKI